jgi:hypothetical protein
MSGADLILAKLNELAEVKAAEMVTRLDYEAKRNEILKTVLAELQALDSEYDPLFESAQNRAVELEDEIKQLTLQHGASVKGRQFQAVYSRGRISWDNPALDQYAANHPEILAYRREGEPSISLRVVKER